MVSEMHERVSVNALVFPNDNLETIAGHFRALAPHRVSFLSPQLPDAALDEAKRLFAPYTIETVMHPFGAPLYDPAGWDAPRERLAQAIGAAEALGARSLYLNAGGRGQLTWEAAAEAFAEAIVPAKAQAEAAGVRLMVEPSPAHYADLHIAHNLRDTIQLAEIAGIDVCIDISSCWFEAGLEASIKRTGPRLGLVQLGDYVFGDRTSPNRAVVGEGDLPLKRIFGWILETGFDGAFDLELIGPRIDAVGAFEATRRSAEATGDILRSLGA
jgi:sugar phosphate isomerase/epimerase